MSMLGSLLRTLLPHVLTKHLACRSKNDVGRSVVLHKLHSSLLVNVPFNLLSNKGLIHCAVQKMQHCLTSLLHIHHCELLSFDDQLACVVQLSARGWIETALVKHDDIFLSILESIAQHPNHLSFELEVALELVSLLQMVEVQTDSFWKRARIIEHLLSLLDELVSLLLNKVVKVAWDFLARHPCYDLRCESH